jgi:hypothetical protein
VFIRRISSILVGLALAVVAGGAAPAYADDGGKDKPSPPPLPAGQPGVQRGTYVFSVYGSRTITPPGGSPDRIEASGSTTAVLGGITDNQVSFNNTSSRVWWYGFNPYNATSVRHTDNWEVDSLGVSPSASVPGGVGWSIGSGGKSASFSREIPNDFRSIHNLASILFRCTPYLCEIYWGRYEVRGFFSFGAAGFEVSDDDPKTIF